MAATKLLNKIMQNGCDCIIYVKETGKHSVVPFYADSIIPISQNGIPIENDEITTDSKEPVFLMPENTNEEFVEKARENEFDIDYDSGYNGKNIIIDGSHLVHGQLKANVRYQSGEYKYIYSTDDCGRISKVHIDELQCTERDYRKHHNPNTAEKQKGDHAGHLIADRFGGSENIDNIVSQSAIVNLSEYKKIENQWANAIKNGKKVSVDIDVKYDEDSMRPSEFIVNYIIDAKIYNKKISN